jgi:hypothetical protein
MPITPSDLALARSSAVRAKQAASKAKRRWEGRMSPESLPWEEGRDLANAVADLAYHVQWMARALEEPK